MFWHDEDMVVYMFRWATLTVCGALTDHIAELFLKYARVMGLDWEAISYNNGECFIER